MNIQTYIQQVGIEKASSTLGVSVPAIKHYRNGIRKVSPSKVLATCKATGWAVTPHELRPDLYPNPTDGIPMELSPDFLDRRIAERRALERREQERRDHERRGAGFPVDHGPENAA